MPTAIQPPQETVPAGAADHSCDTGTHVSRRDFFGLVAAAGALAGTAACSRKRSSTLVPYTRRPEDVVPGVADFYATTFAEGQRAYPVLVKTREGRPIHVAGNDAHPVLRGKTSLRAMADIMGLYDPDRLRGPKVKGSAHSWDEALQRLASGVGAAKAAGKPVLLLTGAVQSPSRKALIADLKRVLPTLEHVAWEAAGGDGASAAVVASFGEPLLLVPDLAKARVVVSLGADFLNGEDPEAMAAFTHTRRLDKPDTMNRLWVFEGPMSLTGQNADQRVPVRPSRLAQVALCLAKALGADLPVPATPPAELHIPAHLWAALVHELKAAGSEALVLCGAHLPFATHRAVHLLNQHLHTQALGAAPVAPLASWKDLTQVVHRLRGGVYGAALLWGVNPVHAHPRPDLWQEGLARTPLTAWIGLMEDETSVRCELALPEHHWLEAWGDHQVGQTLTLQQPAIGPLYDTRQGEDLLLALMRRLGEGVAADHHAYVQARWARDVLDADSPVPFQRFWEACLHEGFLAKPTVNALPAFRQGDVRALWEPERGEGFELLLLPGNQMLDGRYANNGWLQELPDPVTKAVWGNPLTISPGDAQSLGLKDGDQVRLQVGGTQVLTPVLIQPGQAKGVLALSLGYGRTVGGVAQGIGTNAFPLLDVASDCPNLRAGVTLTKTGRRVDLPRTQAHHRMEGRDLVRSWTLGEFTHHVEAPHPPHELHTLYPELTFPEHRWGMVIDLSACTGCSTCVLACGSENNVAVVGPEQVLRGREMHWLRIDRYYEGAVDNPRAVHQPMMCQHCDHAPCENVCPVNATNHSPDGLNQMAYNRCVGTRYCANNCPYKVRRFNFLEYTAYQTEPQALVYNPEVTVRPRGVMEKCTFCVQRIQDGRMGAKAEGRPLKDGEITPACVAACPTGAIVFGDLNDPTSRVSQLARHGRRYKVLEELGARPAITYLAHLRNPPDGEAAVHAAHAPNPGNRESAHVP